MVHCDVVFIKNEAMEGCFVVLHTEQHTGRYIDMGRLWAVIRGDVATGADWLVLEACLPDLPTALTPFASSWQNTFARMNLLLVR